MAPLATAVQRHPAHPSYDAVATGSRHLQLLLLLLLVAALSLAAAACEPAGPSTPTAASQPPVAPSSSPLDAGPVPPDAETTVREQIHPGAKRCYQRGLEVDPTQVGRIVIAVQVDPSGTVADASVAVNSGLSARYD